MRILYDGKIYENQPKGGINRYFNNIISGLPSDCHPILTSRVVRSFTEYPTHKNLKLLEYRGSPHFPITKKFSKFYFGYVELSNSFDVIHPTYYGFLTRRETKLSRQPMVVTVHDMIHEIFPDQIDREGKTAASKRKMITSAQAIICVSENTKKDLLERLPISPERVKVTHLASEIDANMSYGAETIPDQPYYLHVGGRNAYKNFGTLLKAFAKVISVYPELLLAVVGNHFNESEKELIAQLGLDKRIICYGRVNDNHLAKLYRCSLALVYPSLYEGFGIPPLEAICCGTVAITANASSLPEVVGEAGIMFEPTAVDDLADILLFLADHPGERDRLIAKGYEQAKHFSWDKTVAQTLDVYRSLI